MVKTSVTKFKGSMDDANLRRLNCITLDYTPNTAIASSYCTLYVFLKAGGHTINIKFKSGIYKSGTSGTITEDTIVSSDSEVQCVYSLTTNLIGNANVTNFVEITGDVYHITCLTACGSNLLSFTNIERKGLGSLLSADSLFAYGGVSDGRYIVPHGVKYLELGLPSGALTINPEILDGVENLESPIVGTSSTRGTIIPAGSLFSNTSLKVIHSIMALQMADMPINISVLATSSPLITGSVEGFVAKARENGRTSGALAFFYPTNPWGVTYNGKTLSQCVTDNTIPDVSHWAYCVWDANSITWASSQPSELDNYIPLKTPDNFVRQ